jgi:3-hydroxyisobutyrate dehydrogenase-like beta-hydroxyacid dehydrogenase
MSDVSVLGLGLMGSALARAFLSAGQRVTVWNRTAERTETLVGAGAKRSEKAADALRASPLSVVCVRDYTTAASFLRDSDSQTALAGRALLQLSTGTSREAREAEAWAGRIGCGYLDGCIMAYPEIIGRADASIYISGPCALFQQHRELLSALGGDVAFVGEAIGLAAMLDAAHLTAFFGHLVGFIYGIRRCEREGYPIDKYVELVVAGMPAWLVETFGRLGRVIQGSRFDDAEATVATMESALGTIVRDFHESGLNDEFPALMQALFRRAGLAGFGAEDTAALIKLLRG